jgi:hypothetical protein
LAYVGYRSQIVAIDIILPSFWCRLLFRVFPFPPSKAKLIGDVPMNKQNSIPQIYPFPPLSISLHLSISLAISITRQITPNENDSRRENVANNSLCFCLFMGTLPFNLASLGVNGNFHRTKINGKIKDKRTSIDTVRDQYPTYAIFPTPLSSNYRLPLR